MGMLWRENSPALLTNSVQCSLQGCLHRIQECLLHGKSYSSRACLAGEEIFDKDALWVPEEADAARSELPEKLQRIQSTRDALKRDRHKMRRVMHKIKKRSRHFIVSELGIEPDRRAGELQAHWLGTTAVPSCCTVIGERLAWAAHYWTGAPSRVHGQALAGQAEHLEGSTFSCRS